MSSKTAICQTLPRPHLEEGEDVFVAREEVADHQDEVEVDGWGAALLHHRMQYRLHGDALRQVLEVRWFRV